MILKLFMIKIHRKSYQNTVSQIHSLILLFNLKKDKTYTIWISVTDKIHGRAIVLQVMKVRSPFEQRELQQAETDR